MSKAKDKIDQAFGVLAGPLYGDDILPKLKEIMLEEQVFRSLFGDTGKKIDIDGSINISSEIMPILELRIINESFPSPGSYHTGRIEARLLLNNSFQSNYGKKRQLALLFKRYFDSDRYRDIFERVAGLRDLGGNLRADYSLMYRVGGNAVPGIKLSFDFELDPHLWKLANEIDWTEPLDGDLFELTDSELQLFVDGTDELLDTQEIFNPEDA